MPHPVLGKDKINPQAITGLFRPDVGGTVVAYRTVANQDLPPSLHYVGIRDKGFDISKLQVVMRRDETELVEVKRFARKPLYRQMTLAEMLDPKAAGYFKEDAVNDSTKDPRVDSDSILKAPVFGKRRIFEELAGVELPDFDSLHLRRFQIYDGSIYKGGLAKQLLMEKMLTGERLNFRRAVDPTRILAELTFLTPTRPDASIMPFYQRDSQTLTMPDSSGRGFGPLNVDGWGIAGEVAENLIYDLIDAVFRSFRG